jgi:hypothetical protein
MRLNRLKAQHLRKFVSFCFTAAIIASPARVTWAHGGGGDIAVFTTNGQVDVGFAILDENDEFQIFFDSSDSVFQSILVPQPPIPNFPAVGSIEPGYDANEGDLPGSALLTLHVGSLSFYDGSGPVNLLPAVGVSASYPPGPVAVDDQGGFHAHELFGLSDLVNDGQPIPDGVYVAELSASVTGLADSNTYFMVALVDQLINNDADPEGAAEQLGEMVRAFQDDPLNSPEPVYGGKNFTFYAEAIEHVESLVVPEPSSIMLVAFALWWLCCNDRQLRVLRGFLHSVV